MSDLLFDRPVAPPSGRTRPLGTVAISVIAHLAVLAIIVALQLTSALAGPIPNAPIRAFVARAEPPDVPRPSTARVRTTSPTPAHTAAPVPLVAPDAIPIEPAGPPPPPSGGSGLVTDPGIGAGLRTAGQRVELTGGPPPPPAPSTVRAGGDVRAPGRIVYVPPIYPETARFARVEGDVQLEATIDETGAVRNVRVVSSRPLLDRAAIEAVSKWRYTPTQLNGQPVSVVMIVTVRFTLRSP